MEGFNINQMNGEKLMKELQGYVDTINQQNGVLQERLRTYNKDEEIHKLREEIAELRRNSLLIMSDKEKEAAKTFSEEHYIKCHGNVEYNLVGTGIGTVVKIKCQKCNLQQDITDIDAW